MTGKHDKERRPLLVHYAGIVKCHLDPYTVVQTQINHLSFSLHRFEIDVLVEEVELRSAARKNFRDLRDCSGSISARRRRSFLQRLTTVLIESDSLEYD